MNLDRVRKAPLPGMRAIERERQTSGPGTRKPVGDQAFVNRVRPLVGQIAAGHLPLDETATHMVGKVLDAEHRRLQRETTT